MRIISGTFKGRKFYPPAKNWPTRPTTDYAKEGLFNMLMNEIDFEETKMLDLFGGTGNHCYEFISRGCTDVTYVDKFGPALKFVHQIANELEVSEFIKVVKSDVFRFVAKCTESFDYIFAGPPYPLANLNEIPNEVFATAILEKDGIFVLEHDSSNDFSDHPNFVKQRNYGSAIFAFFTHLK